MPDIKSYALRERLEEQNRLRAISVATAERGEEVNQIEDKAYQSLIRAKRLENESINSVKNRRIKTINIVFTLIACILFGASIMSTPTKPSVSEIKVSIELFSISIGIIGLLLVGNIVYSLVKHSICCNSESSNVSTGDSDSDNTQLAC